MRRRHYITEGIVLGRKNYSEADRVLVIFTKDFGRKSFLAKAVRKPQSRKRGALEVFNRIKFSAVGGHGLDLITEVEAVETFRRVRRNIKKVAVAFFFVETIGRVTRDEEKNEQLYGLIADYLSRLAHETALRQLRADFTKDVLVLLGFWRADQELADPDNALEKIVERKMFSVRVGKKII